MSEVRYSVNGKYFKDFGIYISESIGLFDKLKRKNINAYDWNEYHGETVDLTDVRLESREITLKGFVIGNDWKTMKANFDVILDEFQKEGTQSLLIEPFGIKPLPYQVYIQDSVKLEKTFVNGKMVGVFTMKLIEPNPVKKVYTWVKPDTILQNNIYFQFYTPKWATIFWGDSVDYVRGNVDVNRDYSLAPEKYRVKVDYKIWGTYYKIATYALNTYHFFTQAKFSTPGIKTMWLVGKNIDKTYDLLGEVHVNVGSGFVSFDIPLTCAPTDYERFFIKMSEECVMKDTSVYTTDWVPTATSGFIIIAGVISEFTPVVTNAAVVWEKL